MKKSRNLTKGHLTAIYRFSICSYSIPADQMSHISFKIMTEKEVNKIARKFALSLIKSGFSIMRSAFKLEPEEVKMGDIESFLKKNFPKKTINLADARYKLISIYKWKEIIDVDWISWKKYIKNVSDCDNYAYYMAAVMSVVFNINSCGVIHGHVYDKYTGKWLYGHFWNGIIVKENGEFQIYFLEPMNNKMVKVKKGQPVYFGRKKYSPLVFRFF